MASSTNPQLQPLTPEEKKVIVDKGTEAPFTGEYDEFWQPGIYLCRRCLTPLYKSTAKFHSGCGWPSFDQELPGKVNRQLDADGKRTEIICATCNAHLGHVFEGEHLTPLNTRHCVNSVSLRFKSAEIAYFAGGCFWCTEAVFQELKGVWQVTPGYAGGTSQNPTYFRVSEELTGHAEVIEVIFDPTVITYDQLLDVFFHTHNPTTLNQQGADVGTQYRSLILATSKEQLTAAQNYKKELNQNHEFDQPIVTEIKEFEAFYPAEPEHLEYYRRNQDQAYCQVVISPKLAAFHQRYQNLLKKKSEQLTHLPQPN